MGVYQLHEVHYVLPFDSQREAQASLDYLRSLLGSEAYAFRLLTLDTWDRASESQRLPFAVSLVCMDASDARVPQECLRMRGLDFRSSFTDFLHGHEMIPAIFSPTKQQLVGDALRLCKSDAVWLEVAVLLEEAFVGSSPK